ncbi:hypothetical protein [Nisaea denitrificans]|uniref:hypothetical protein n=1 Tax=Nisaea denitrificans TaxID=390877 RepID=UPI00048E6A14|nr:hypothetical protein [Nisaea denitrificans]
MTDVTQSFADKLRLILRVTGCETQKEFYAKLKSVNPDTGYDPVRAYKWVQGRSSPRNRSVYEDLARLIDLGLSGDDLRTCSYDDFYRLLAGRYGDLLLDIPAPDRAPGHDTVAAQVKSDEAPPAYPLPDYLVGRYLTLSRAWSPHRPGCLITGVTDISHGPDGNLLINYIEHLPWGTLKLNGPAQRIGRNMTTQLVSRDQEMLLTFTYALPPAPGVVLAGILSGVTMHDAEMRPVAGRVIGLRLQEGSEARIEAGADGYLGLTAEEIAEQLVRFDMKPDQAARLAPDVLEFLIDTGDRGLIEAPVTAINTIMGKALSESPAPTTPPVPPKLYVVDKKSSGRKR